jgi:putative NADPH-quinone reductase
VEHDAESFANSLGAEIGVSGLIQASRSTRSTSGTSRCPFMVERVSRRRWRSLPGRPRPETQGAAWAEVQRLFVRFDAAGDYLFTVPMWNHSVPWVLKHLIDTISQPGKWE